ncbi:MAG: mandelate racemase/muconate lactonizing enzyme family protein [Gammaproteobacteria bacterium]|nr:mandelate racemase/muconate lactonizing enzyme family protein [Gammaproteobacteria bacterium]MDE2251508.1 mandelate racemase/muconate lactonizing enzyme family protein [Gammaproteobacteria bacterium]
MTLKDIRTFVVGNPPPHYGGRYFVFVKLTTSGNVSGIGEAYCLPFHPDIVVKLLEDVFARYLQGQDPHDIEAMWRRVYSAGFTQHPDLALMGVLSSLEMACWDIIGKEAGQPVYRLLGGRVHERLRSYTYIYARPGDKTDVYHDPDLSAQRAAEYLAQGFTAIKFDPVGPYSAFDGRQLSLPALDLSERFVRQLREAVGSKADLLFGTHGQMTAAGAIRLARRLEPYDPLWFEEPVPPDAPEEMARVARGTSIPIATGERLATKYDFARLLRAGSAAIFQMNLGRVGGLLEAKKIAGMAETQHVQIAPHLYCGPVVGAANIQLATCSPNFLILEGIERWDGFHADILRKPIRWSEGYVIPPTEPGLGVELNEEVALRHPYRGERLHLEMADQPIV